MSHIMSNKVQPETAPLMPLNPCKGDKGDTPDRCQQHTPLGGAHMIAACQTVLHVCTKLLQMYIKLKTTQADPGQHIRQGDMVECRGRWRVTSGFM